MTYGVQVLAEGKLYLNTICSFPTFECFFFSDFENNYEMKSLIITIVYKEIYTFEVGICTFMVF